VEGLKLLTHVGRVKQRDKHAFTRTEGAGFGLRDLGQPFLGVMHDIFLGLMHRDFKYSHALHLYI
jgi:hypothetical protein